MSSSLSIQPVDLATISSPHIPSFLPNSHGWTTDHWEKEVLRPENLELTRRSIVFCIAHRKAQRHVQHEYIDVGFSVGDVTVWVRVERNGTPAREVPRDAILDPHASPKANDNNDTPASDQPPTPNRGAFSSLNSMSSTPSSLSSWGSSSTTAHDTVRLIPLRQPIDISLPPPKEPDDREINVVELSEKRKLSVTEFAMLLESISGRAPKYDAIFKNCYWYAGAVCNCVCREYPHPVKRDSSRSAIYGFPLGAKLTPNSAYDELCQAWRAKAATLENLKTKQQVSTQCFLNSFSSTNPTG